MKKFFLLFTAAVIFCFATTIPGQVQLTGNDRVWEIRGSEASAYLGRPIVCADFNGDGLDDVAVGEDRWSYDTGERPTVFLFRGQHFISYSDDVTDLSSETSDVMIYGETASDNFSNSLAAGDLNNDGIMDLIAADSTMTVSGRTEAGTVYVFFGKSDFFSTSMYDLQQGDWDMKILGPASYGDLGGAGMTPFGGSTSNAVQCGDVNGDGIDDLIMGAHFLTAGSLGNAGKVFVVFGDGAFSSGQTIDLASQADSIISGNEQDAELGTNIATGDVNGDGIQDIILGEDLGSDSLWSSEGRVFIIYGSASFSASISLNSADVKIYGDNAGDQLGDAVVSGDLNDDGIDDIAALAYGWDSSGSSSDSVGAVYGFFGGSSIPSTINLASTSPDFFVEGYNVTNALYWNMDSGDYNGDGVDDLMLTSRDGERPGFNAEGRVYILLGKSSLDTSISIENEEFDYIINGGEDYLQLCDTLTSGDIDGDGADELLLGAPFVNSGTGKLLIFDLNPRLSVSSEWSMYE